MNYKFEATIIDENTEKVIIRITSNDYEDFESEQGKSKWANAVLQYEEELQAKKAEMELEEEDNTISLNEAKSNQND